VCQNGTGGMPKGNTIRLEIRLEIKLIYQNIVKRANALNHMIYLHQPIVIDCFLCYPKTS
ncbi:TPA: hypothetical protein ACIJQX_004894, partial [Klebsiella pneumoniae]